MTLYQGTWSNTIKHNENLERLFVICLGTILLCDESDKIALWHCMTTGSGVVLNVGCCAYLDGLTPSIVDMTENSELSAVPHPYTQRGK